MKALIPDETMTSIKEMFGGFSQWYIRLSVFNDMTRDLLNAQDSPPSREDSELARKSRYVMTDMIDKQREVIEGLITAIEEDEAIEREVEFAQASLPSTEATDKILRYETAIQRQNYRAMSELDRLQRRRKGDIVPPTFNVEVSNSG